MPACLLAKKFMLLDLQPTRSVTEGEVHKMLSDIKSAEERPIHGELEASTTSIYEIGRNLYLLLLLPAAPTPPQSQPVSGNNNHWTEHNKPRHEEDWSWRSESSESD